MKKQKIIKILILIEIEERITIFKNNSTDMITKLNNSNVKAYNVSNSNKILKKYHLFETNFINSFFRSFFLLIVSEVMDKTFIIILFFSTKLPPSNYYFSLDNVYYL